jgi:hypothetical protein
LGQVPPKLAYPKLHNLCSEKNILVSDCYKQGEWVIGFRRPFGRRRCCSGRTC